MTNNNHQPSPITPEEADRYRFILKDFTGVKVDARWLKDYDLGMLELYAMITFRRALEMVSDRPMYERNDALVSAHSVASAIRDIFIAGGNKVDESECLSVLLIAAAERAYRYGVHDAHAGMLSDKLQHHLTDSIDTFTQRHEEMMAFHKELCDS